VKFKSSVKKLYSQPVPKIVTTDSHTIHGQFTGDEIRAIKELLKSRQESAPAFEMEPTLRDRIKQLPKEEKTRNKVKVENSIHYSWVEFFNTYFLFKQLAKLF
jgi:hypothetical protein